MFHRSRSSANELALSRYAPWMIASAATLLWLHAFGLFYEGFVSDHYFALLTAPFADRPAAERAYARLPAAASAQARAASAERLVDADPTDPRSWTAVAYEDWLAHGRLTPIGAEALDRSYTVSFFDRRIAVWRVAFALDNWTDIAPRVRRDVLLEARLALSDPGLAEALKPHLKTARSPSGRLAAALLAAEAAHQPPPNLAGAAASGG